MRENWKDVIKNGRDRQTAKATETKEINWGESEERVKKIKG